MSAATAAAAAPQARRLLAERYASWLRAASCGRPISTQSKQIVERPPMVLPLQGAAVYSVWGANTNVGKTLASVGIAYAAQKLQAPISYIKPVQTGFPNDSDARLVALATGANLSHGSHAAEAAGVMQPPTLRGRQLQRTGDAPAHASVLFAWGMPVSPHLAVRRQGRQVDDGSVVAATAAEVQASVKRMQAWAASRALASHGPADDEGTGLVIVETAGGVTSPGPSGTLACDLLRPLRLPAVLVGDPRLGGIGATLSAYESLLLRGYDVDAVVLLEQQAGAQLDNADFLRSHLQSCASAHRMGLGVPQVLSLPGCPPAPDGHDTSVSGLDPHMLAWLEGPVASSFAPLVRLMLQRAQQRRLRLAEAQTEAASALWWPFTQHKSVQPGGVTVVDHRCGEHWHVYQPPASAATTPTTTATRDGGASSSATQLQAQGQAVVSSLYDAAGSWWTQAATATQQPELARSVAYAAGRYLHVMFPQTAHEPALALTRALLSGPGAPGAGWASRVFYSDDGSTAIEVALKMALRKYLFDRGELTSDADAAVGSSGDGSGSGGGGRGGELHVLGLHNAYHGDTLGAQDCVAPSVYNARAQAPWYSGRGLFLHPPYIGMVKGQWVIHDAPSWLQPSLAFADPSSPPRPLASPSWSTLEEALQQARETTDLSASSASPLVRAYRAHIEGSIAAHEAASGARLAAGIIEPLLQGAGGMLLMEPLFVRTLVQVCRDRNLPVILDEVFTGLFRLGAPSAASLLGLTPDIACYGKLLTGGAVPMAVTLATEAVFRSFEGPSKLFALLHGHSYTAFPIGCAAAATSLALLTSPAANPALCAPATRSCGCAAPCGRLAPLWPGEAVTRLSYHPRVSRVVALGTVLAVELITPKVAGAGGYASTGSSEVVALLRQRHGVYARPLGDVVYMMVPPTGSPDTAAWLIGCMEHAIQQWAAGVGAGVGAGDGCVV